MSLRFHSTLGALEIWSATSDGFSFVISYESPTGPGLKGRVGYLASWRAVHNSRSAIRITGSPFKTFDEAKAACVDMLKHLTDENLAQ